MSSPLSCLSIGVKAEFMHQFADAQLIGWIALIRVRVSRVVQDDIEYDEESLLMCRIHQLTKFIVGVEGIISQARLGAKKVVNAVAVIGMRVKRKILENRTKPDRACT